MEERIVVFSDVHGDTLAMERLREAGAVLYATSLLSLGDLCPDPINPLFASIRGVRGNMDRWSEYGDLFFPPETLEFNFSNHRIVATHGHKYSPFDFNLKDGDIFLSGHTHIPSLRKQNGVYYFNPGSPSRPRSSTGPTFGLLTVSGFSLLSLLDLREISNLNFSSSQ